MVSVAVSDSPSVCIAVAGSTKSRRTPCQEPARHGRGRIRAMQLPPPSPWGLVPSSIAQWVGAIATSIAVAIALFKDEALRFFRRPKLRVRIESVPPDCLLVPNATVFEHLPPVIRPLWSGGIYYVRLWIENNGAGRAEQVQVFVDRLYKQDANHEFKPVADFEPMNLRWSNSKDLSNPEVFAPGISQGFGKHCDLLSVSDPANPTDHPGAEYQEYAAACVGTLQLEVVPSGGRNRLVPGDYVLQISVGASNARPLTTYVQINLRGTWSADPTTMFRDNLGVKKVSRP